MAAKLAFGQAPAKKPNIRDVHALSSLGSAWKSSPRFFRSPISRYAKSGRRELNESPVLA